MQRCSVNECGREDECQLAAQHMIARDCITLSMHAQACARAYYGCDKVSMILPQHAYDVRDHYDAPALCISA